jgi:predicted nucleic acid-binding protein
MSFLLDTDWIVHWLKGKKRIIDKIETYRKSGLSVSIISVAELYEGIYGSNHPEDDEQILKDFLRGVTLLEVSEDVCKKFGELRNGLRRKGELIGNFDLLIASTALINNLTILSDNVEHYKRIKGLKFETSEL